MRRLRFALSTAAGHAPMQMPAIDDTIVAVSSGWQPTPVGIVRLSGLGSFPLVAQLGIATPHELERPQFTAGRLRLDAAESLPATVFWFCGPRSYTGQDVAEIHTVGCLPLLRELSARLIELGARRALPGEFTARAFVNGRLAASQVQGVLTLMQSEHEAGVRDAARLARGSQRRQIADIVERITQLLARIEAGIDFVDEEDIRFVAPAEVVEVLDALITALDQIAARATSERRLGRPHIALAGLPNAGKSTLFNALVGYERALVSPVLGTTRDVLAAEVEVGGFPAVVQDCAGLRGTAGELELASHLAAEHAAQLADLVLWVHSADLPWAASETAACAGIEPRRRVLVLSKLDLAGGRTPLAAPIPFRATVSVCADDGSGLEELRETVAAFLAEHRGLHADEWPGAELRCALAALWRARELADSTAQHLPYAEVMSIELRTAYASLADDARGALDEQLLDRIFAEFCVGK